MFDFPQPQLGPGCRADAPPPVGTIFPQPRLADGRLMDEAIGQRFAIVGDAALLDGLARCRPAARRRPDWLARHGARAAILRPDRYVFALARDRAELEAAALELAGRLVWHGQILQTVTVVLASIGMALSLAHALAYHGKRRLDRDTYLKRPGDRLPALYDRRHL